MTNWKSKYLEMKLKYINTKQKAGMFALPNTSYKIIHFSELPFGARAAEYIKSKDGQINITSHGMGSGIYGVTEEYLQENPPLDDSKSYEFYLENPFILINNDICILYEEASKALMRFLVYIIAQKNKQTDSEDQDNEIRNFIHEFLQLFPSRLNSLKVFLGIKEFIFDYKNNEYFVEMPINYILKNHNYDGVFSPYPIACGSWSKGNVKFVNNPIFQIGDKTIINYYNVRNGTKKIHHTLTEDYNYVKESDYFIKLENKTEFVSRGLYRATGRRNPKFKPPKTYIPSDDD